MKPERRARLERIYAAFARRDADLLCPEISEDFAFSPVTARELGRVEPYRGRAGVAEYLADVERVWIELRLTQHSYTERGEHVLVRGRVWARGATRLTDNPAAWLWRFGDERPVECRVFDDEAAAITAFEACATPTGSVDQA